MKQSQDPNRARYLELSEELIDLAALARNFAMKPGNAWLARAELAKASGVISDLEGVLQDIQDADEAS